jgi:hypothetical protein
VAALAHAQQPAIPANALEEGKGSLALTGNDRKSGSEEAKPFCGLYRTVAWAYVSNGEMAFQVPEAEYRAFEYKPDFDSLPWKESYNRRRRP